MPDERHLMSSEEMRRIISRIAHEIIERNQGAHNLILVGLQRRGVPLANRVAAAIEAFEHVDVPVGALDINLYRDDLTSSKAGAVRHRPCYSSDDFQPSAILTSFLRCSYVQHGPEIPRAMLYRTRQPTILITTIERLTGPLSPVL